MYCGYRMFPSANELYRMFLSANELQPPLVLKPILTFPKGRNKLPCFVKDLFSQSFQPPLVLPRRGDADYSGSVKDREMLVTLAYDNR